jgi:ComF family protein
LCRACATTLSPTPDEHCVHCGEPGRFVAGRCPRCTHHRPAFLRAWAPFAHEGALAQAIHRFKYEDQPDLARPLGALLAEGVGRAPAPLPGLLVPVPLHESRRRERKYDQAALLTGVLARHLGRPMLDALDRVRPTLRQVGLSDEARAGNVAGAFSACVGLNGPCVLVDDVLTTGATANEAATELRRAGATTVCVLSLARAGRESLGA